MSLLWDKILFGKQKLERPSNTIFDGIRLFCHIFVSLKYIMLNQNAIAWYCLIIPRDDIEETIVHLCLLNFEIDGENEKMRKIWMSYSFKRRVSDWNVLKIVVMRYYVLYKHTHTHTQQKKMGKQTLLLLAHVYQILSTLFKSNQNFFNIFSCWFFRSVIFHLHTNQVSKFSHIMELNINFWFTGKDTRIGTYTVQYMFVRIYRSHLSLFRFGFEICGW